jgi:hypothetical protein
MAIINFKEIPESHGTGEAGLRDSFELFAETFFSDLGFTIIDAPSRGTDNGKDLIIEESVKGVLDESESKIRWLVSCKHKAHSGNSVRPEDDSEFNDRLTTHQCNGFIAFYSTLPSTKLSAYITGLQNKKYKTRIFNAENIETVLLKSKSGIALIERFFPESFAKWRVENPVKAKLFKEGEFDLKCMACGTNLMKENSVKGYYYRVKELKNLSKVVDFRWSCSNRVCDDILNLNNYSKGHIEFFDHIDSYATPSTYLLFVMDVLCDLMEAGDKYSEDASKNIKYLMSAIYPFVARDMTTKEKEILEGQLMMRSIG